MLRRKKHGPGCTPNLMCQLLGLTLWTFELLLSLINGDDPQHVFEAGVYALWSLGYLVESHMFYRST